MEKLAFSRVARKHRRAIPEADLSKDDADLSRDGRFLDRLESPHEIGALAAERNINHVWDPAGAARADEAARESSRVGTVAFATTDLQKAIGRKLTRADVDRLRPLGCTDPQAEDRRRRSLDAYAMLHELSEWVKSARPLTKQSTPSTILVNGRAELTPHYATPTTHAEHQLSVVVAALDRVADEMKSPLAKAFPKWSERLDPFRALRAHRPRGLDGHEDIVRRRSESSRAPLARNKDEIAKVLGLAEITDRQLALVSLIVGNWPDDVDEGEPIAPGEVLRLELATVRKQRQKRGNARGPAPRRRVDAK